MVQKRTSIVRAKWLDFSSNLGILDLDNFIVSSKVVGRDTHNYTKKKNIVYYLTVHL